MARASADLDDQPSRYVVGIDLGTTNSAVAFVDTQAAQPKIQTFAVPQLVAPGQVEAHDTLPSFHYQAATGEFAAGALQLHWSAGDADFVVGQFARDHGVLVGNRQISSAKSWLCHAGVDRTSAVLPWHAAADVTRLSPVEVSARYLAHLRQAWNQRFKAQPLEQQDVVLTLPASFDEVARELTIKAAAKAGLPRVILIEEPQAAFYAWIDAHRDSWETLVTPGQKILVCDVGGGTSDFTLIHATAAEGGKVRFQRIAVGDHLILGGDNLDLALAHHVEQKLTSGGGQLQPLQWTSLVRSCRKAKELLLGDDAPETATIHLPSSGAKLIGGGLTTTVSRDAARELLVDGFFPLVGLNESPANKRSGFQEFGLPYAADPAITRYLAAFLRAHRTSDATRPQDAEAVRPDVLLLNGGVFASSALRNRLIEALGHWFSDGQAPWQPMVLKNERLDLAVAHGAAYYGLVRRGIGVRITAGLARSYYVGIADHEGRNAAICLAPAGAQEGREIELSGQRFALLTRQPVEFQLYYSSTRLTDQAGEIIAAEPLQMTAFPPLRTVLDVGKKSTGSETVEVILHARLTEIGTLEVWCSEATGNRQWRLQFDVRAATQTDLTAHQGLAERQGLASETELEPCRELIQQTFGAADAKQGERPEGLVKRLADIIGQSRDAWAPSLLRGLWDALLQNADGRKLSAMHEARWLNLLGFALRPGYGMAIDDWRVSQTWRTLQGKLAFASPANRAEWWILWRRISGGLPAAQQRALADPLLAELRASQRALAKGRGLTFRPAPHEAAELWRLLGSLELIDEAWKIELGQLLLLHLAREKTQSVRSASAWALGRIGARTPLYGPINTVVPAETAAAWAQAVIAMDPAVETAPLALMQLARRTRDRYRDVDEPTRLRVLAWLRAATASPHWIELVEQGGELEAAEQGQVFGESLPVGLRLVATPSL